MKLIFLIISLSLNTSHSFSPENVTWGFFGHKKINRLSIFTLPSEMFGFFKDHVEYITEQKEDGKKNYKLKELMNGIE